MQIGPACKKCAALGQGRSVYVSVDEMVSEREARSEPRAGDACLRPAALIPTFNNAATLGGVIERTLAQLPDVLVVDDGSTDATAQVLAGFGSRIRVHRHPRNLGKGRALRDGFEVL